MLVYSSGSGLESMVGWISGLMLVLSSGPDWQLLFLESFGCHWEEAGYTLDYAVEDFEVIEAEIQESVLCHA